MKRPAPPLTDRTRAFWQSGADGLLRIARCQACGWRLQPPGPVCPKCHDMDIQFEPVSGRGRVHSWTVNRYAFNPDMPPPYILAEVELEEQRNLLLLSNLVGIDPALVRFGMPVQVEFDHVDDTWIPVFTA